MVSIAVLVVTFLLLGAGIVGSLIPAVPGASLSLLGILLYWWASGYTTPGTLALLAFVALAVAAMLVDLFGGAIAARHGGASTRTVVAAIAVSLVLAVVTGPLGILLGVPATVFLLEFDRHGDRQEARRAALVTTVGIFASTAVQVLLTATLLLGFAVVLWL